MSLNVRRTATAIVVALAVPTIEGCSGNMGAPIAPSRIAPEVCEGEGHIDHAYATDGVAHVVCSDGIIRLVEVK